MLDGMSDYSTINDRKSTLKEVHRQSPTGLIFYFIIFYKYFTWNAKRLSRHAGLSAIAEFIGCITTKLSW